MRRIDVIYNKLKKINKGEGATANEIAHELELNRANVSRDLNELVKLEKAKKIKSKPVVFIPNINEDIDINFEDTEKEELESSLDRFVKKNHSMKQAM